MISGAWCLYERRSQRWLFCRRKRIITPGTMGLMLMLVVSASFWLG